MPVLAPKAQPSTVSFRWRSSSIGPLPPQILATPDCVDRSSSNEIQFLAERNPAVVDKAAHAQAPRRKATQRDRSIDLTQGSGVYLVTGGPLFMRIGPRPTVRRMIKFCLASVALMLRGYAHAHPTDHARPTDDSLRIYAVDIWQDPPQSWGPGRGVYLGKGLVIPPPMLSHPLPTPSRACTSLAWSCLRPPSGRAISSEWT